MILFRPFVIATAVAATIASCSSSPRPPRARMSVKEIVERSKPAIVRVEVDAETDEARAGTGFAIDPSGIIVTNLHVISEARTIDIRLLDGSAIPVRHVFALDFDRDLALLKIDVEQPMPHLSIGDSDAVSAGDPVIAIGNPLGVLDYTVSDGLISSIREIAPEGGPSTTLLQISAPISQGSSGGPLFNPYGEVIGVTTAIIISGQNLNFAVPSKYIKPMLTEPTPMTLAQFMEATMEATKAPMPSIERQVPEHDVSILDGCTREQIETVATAIAETIHVGAPLYNKGEIEACYRIYELTSTRFANEAGCDGIRRAFRDGLERAATLETYKEKAWALRDTFDALIKVMVRKQRSSP